MREPLTVVLLVEQLKRLFAAFPQSKLAAQNIAFTAETYKDGLRGIDGEAFKQAIQIIIQNDQFFPKIARIREAAHEWVKRNRAEVAAATPASWDVCGVCHARVEATEITRPRLYQDDRGRDVYVVIKPTVFRGAKLETGSHILRGELLAALQDGVRLEYETVPNPRYSLTHRPGPHHAHRAKEEDAA